VSEDSTHAAFRPCTCVASLVALVPPRAWLLTVLVNVPSNFSSVRKLPICGGAPSVLAMLCIALICRQVSLGMSGAISNRSVHELFSSSHPAR